MILDIQRTVIKIQLRRFLTLIGFTIIIILTIVMGNAGSVVLGIKAYTWALIISLLYLFSLILEAILELNYIYFSDEEELILLRFFSMSMFNRKKNSIEIPKSVFRGYEIQKSVFGFKKRIVLFQQLKEKVVKYPPVSVTGLSNKELQLILKTLDKYR